MQVRDGQTDAVNDMAWLRQLLDWQKETSDPGEFLESLRFEINASEVYVFTPKGQLVGLPAGSTPVDFAYAVHTEVGHHCIGARVNGRLVPLESRLDNGDVVEVLTSKADSAGPSRDWLSFVRSARARNKIKHWFTKERREEMIDEGKDSLAKAMRKQGLPLQRLTSVESLTGVAEELRFAGIEGLYAAIGEGNVSAQHVVSRLVASVGGEEGASEDIAEAATPGHRAAQPPPPRRPRGRRQGHVRGLGQAGPLLHPGARRRHPRLRHPRQRRLGAPPRLHQRRVPALASPRRSSRSSGRPTSGSVFLVQLQVEALDRSRLLSDVTRVISDNGVNILSAAVTTSRDRVAKLHFTFEMGDPAHLGHVVRAVQKVDGVFDAHRVTGGRRTDA